MCRFVEVLIVNRDLEGHNSSKTQHFCNSGVLNSTSKNNDREDVHSWVVHLCFGLFRVCFSFVGRYFGSFCIFRGGSSTFVSRLPFVWLFWWFLGAVKGRTPMTYVFTCTRVHVQPLRAKALY